MSQVYEGDLVATGMKVAIVVSRFNEFIGQCLLQGAVDALRRHGMNKEDIDIAWVPGAFEIPLIADQMARSNQYDAIITLGVVIRGATSHYDYVCNGVASGVTTVSLERNLPVLFGVLTVESIEQGIERAGTKAGNKGRDTAVSAIEMVNLQRKLMVNHG